MYLTAGVRAEREECIEEEKGEHFMAYAGANDKRNSPMCTYIIIYILYICIYIYITFIFYSVMITKTVC